MVKTSPGLSNSGGVGQHADGSLDLGKITSGYDCWWLVVDTDLETSWAPVDELDGSLGLDGGNGGVDILGDDISTVEETTGHVLSVSWVAFDHLVGGLETGVGDLSNRQLLVVGLLGGDDWGVGDQREMDTRVRYQVSLELSQINVEGTIESERSGDGRNNLSDESVQVGVGRSLNIHVTSADVIDGFIVYHEGTVRVLQSGMGSEDRVVRLNNSSCDLGRWVDGKFKLGFLSVVNRKSLQEERSESRSGTSTERMEDKESLESSTLVSQLSDSIQAKIYDLLSDGVVTTSVVVSGILLSGDQLLRVEQLSVGSSTDLINNCGLEIEEDSTRYMLSSSSLREEGVESVVSVSNGLVRRHLTIRLDTMLQAVQLPTGITNLATCLTNVN
jgi:hypothetical protein